MTISDQQAVDAIATYLGTTPEWPGAEALEVIAEIVGQTSRPHPGDRAGTYADEFARATGRTAPADFVHGRG